MHEKRRSEVRAVWVDLLAVAVVSALFAAASVHFELGERIAVWTQDRERYQADELPALLLVVALGFVWFAWRRARALRAELARRRAAEAALAAALDEKERLERANVRIQEDERRHLARELHDELGQYLNAIKVEMVGLRQGAASDAGLGRSVASILGIVDHLHATVRDIVQRLRPAGLDELGLAAAIEHCVEGWRHRLPSTRFELVVHGDCEAFGEALNMAVYRIVQEGLTNVARHAQATRVDIRIARHDDAARNGDTVSVTVADDGMGRTAGSSASGMGLLGMRERVESLGGAFAARNGDARGYRIEARLPIRGAGVR